MARKRKSKKILLGKVSIEDVIKAERKASRECEIEAHGRQISGRKMLHASKKTYNRKKLTKPSIKDSE